MDSSMRGPRNIFGLILLQLKFLIGRFWVWFAYITKAAFIPDTRSRIQVSRTSNLYPDSGYMATDTSGYNVCSRGDNFVADTGYM